MDTGQQTNYTEWEQSYIHYWYSVVEIFVLLRSLDICDFFAMNVVMDVIQQKVK